MLLLLIGIVLICLRVVLMSIRALLNVSHPESKEGQGRVSKFASKQKQKVGKAVKSKVKYAGGVATYAVATFTDRYSEASKKILKHIIRFVDFLIVLWAAGIAALIAFIVVIALLLASVIGGIWSGAIDIGDLNSASSSNSGPVDGGPAKDGGNDSDSGGGTTEVPKNMDKKEWERADDLGQKIASTAISSSIMPFPGSKSNDTNNGHLVYQQGNTPVGYYDCSTFISGVFEATGYTQGGKKAKKKYDFKKNKKSDLQDYKTSSGTKSFIKSKKKDSIVTKMGDSGWKDKVVPGDIMVSGSHIAMYVGKNKDGKQIVAHAGSSSSKVFYDVMLKENGKQVGITTLSDWMMSAGEVIIYRPSKVVG